MGLFEDLKELGVDIDGGLKRINGNEKLYTRLLGTFVKTIRNNDIQPDFDSSDLTPVIEKAHSIKGTSGNMSITPVYEAYTEITNQLRAGRPEDARPLIEQILPVQNQIIACIEKYMDVS